MLRRFALAFIVVAATAWGQSSQASISGVITDPQGAVVPNVEVAATEIATGVKTATRTNESGFYSLRPLPIGDYTVAANLDGFRRHVRDAINLTTGQSMELNIVLELGAMAETVTVSARASLLETRNADAGQLVESQSIEDMPLGDRRAMNLIEITGAAVFVDYDSGSKPNFSLAGGRSQSQGFYIDGGTAQNMRIGVGQIDTDPPVESLQEVKVLSNAFSAEYGSSASGVIVTNTKSGSNQFKGSLFEYLRNQVLDPPNYFAPIVDGKKDKPALRYNVFGGTIGGPIRHDKTFFFFSYEGSRRRDGSIRTMTVPTELQKTGDFSQTYNGRKVLVQMYDPATGRNEGTTVVRDPFPGNRIPVSRMDPVALKILPFYPKENRAPDDLAGANNFRANDVTALTRDNYIIKVDHHLRSYDKLTVRYLYNSDNAARLQRLSEPADGHQDRYGAAPAVLVRHLDAHLQSGRAARVPLHLRQPHQSRAVERPGAELAEQAGSQGPAGRRVPAVRGRRASRQMGASTQERRQFPIRQYPVRQPDIVDSRPAFHQVRRRSAARR